MINLLYSQLETCFYYATYSLFHSDKCSNLMPSLIIFIIVLFLLFVPLHLQNTLVIKLRYFGKDYVELPVSKNVFRILVDVGETDHSLKIRMKEHQEKTQSL